MNQAALLYESLQTVGALAQLVTDRVQENIYLEFKTQKDGRTPELLRFR